MAVWMETFCFICSVRLGVIIVCVGTSMFSLLTLVYLLAEGNEILKIHFFDPIESNAELKEQFALNFIVNLFDKDPDKLGLFLVISSAMNLVITLAAVIGALRLLKWLLIPLIVFEFIRFVILMAHHIILMIILKKKLNLGVLIAATVAGGFGLLLIGYMWASVVAFFQILQVVETDRYKALYGSDPLNPRDPTIEAGVANVRMYKTPNFDQITPLKNEHVSTKKLQPQHQHQHQLLQQQSFKEKNLAAIQLSARDLQEFRNWYGHELASVRKSNLIRFS